MKDLNSAPNKILEITVCFSAFLLCLAVLLVSSPLPLADDFDAILQFLISFYETPLWQARFNLITTPHNEHLIYVPRIISIALVEIGIYDSRITIVLALGALSLSAYLLKYLSDTKCFALSAAAALIIFSPHPFEAWTWSLAAQQYSLVILSALGTSLLAFPKDSTEKQTSAHLIGVIPLVIVALGSQASGALVPLCILGVSILQKRVLVPWLIITPIALLPTLLTFSLPIEGSAFPNLLNLLGYFLQILGSAFLQFGSAAALTSGVIILAVYLAVILKGSLYKYPSLLSFFTFLILSAITISVSRSGINENLDSMPHRYVVFGLFLLSSAILSLDKLFQKHRQVIGNCTFTLVLTSLITGWIIFYPDYLQRWQFKHDSEISLSLGAFPPLHPIPKHADVIYNKAIRMGLLNQHHKNNLPKIESLLTESEACSSGIELAKDPRSKDGAGKVVWESMISSDDLLFGTGYTIPPHGTCTNCEFLVGLYNGENYYIANTAQRTRQDVVRTFGNITTKFPGFRVFVETAKLPTGQYSIQPIWRENGKCFTRKTKTTIQKK